MDFDDYLDQYVIGSFDNTGNWYFRHGNLGTLATHHLIQARTRSWWLKTAHYHWKNALRISYKKKWNT